MGYPGKRDGKTPFEVAPKQSFWLCIQPTSGSQPFDNLITAKIKEERSKLHGKFVVASMSSPSKLCAPGADCQACGPSSFTNLIRSSVIDNSDGMAIDFVETEYRPQGMRPSYLASSYQLPVQKLRRERRSQDTELRDLTAGSTAASSMYSVELS